MSKTPDPSKAVEAAKPEVKKGPLGIPYVKPKGAPDLPEL